jgi:hypothetical protein
MPIKAGRGMLDLTWNPCTNLTPWVGLKKDSGQEQFHIYTKIKVVQPTFDQTEHETPSFAVVGKSHFSTKTPQSLVESSSVMNGLWGTNRQLAVPH